MRAQRPVLPILIAAVAALVGAAGAWAATPQTIYKDLADNGRLDGRYKKADIARAFNLERVVKTDRPEPAQVRRAPVARTTETRSSRKVPFTGLDLALLLGGGGPLLVLGIVLRRRLAPSPGRPEAVRG
jgi:hypothetical protein